MTSSALAASSAAQQPRVAHWPDYTSTSGHEAIELAAMAGLHLDPWQQLVLIHSLGERADGSWAAFEVGLTVSRQTGKGSILEARQLAGLFLLGERLIVHSAHQFDTSLEAFRRLLFLIEETPDFDRRVKRVSRSHGEEGIELRGGQRIRFRTRTKGGGRGFTADCLILDEDMILPETTVGALLPTLSARPNPQVWYAGSAVDQTVHEDGLVKARVRHRGLSGDDPRLAYFEWSLDYDSPDDVPAAVLDDEQAWADANPSLGIRITAEHVANERRSFGDGRTFAVERLGVGDWPAVDGTAGAVIDQERWQQIADASSTVSDPVCFAFDVAPDRSRASIGVAGTRTDGLRHVEVIQAGRGTDWVVPRVVELVRKHSPHGVVCDGAGPAGSLIHELEQQGVSVTVVSTKEHAQAAGMLFDAIEGRAVRHLPNPDLTAAAKAATKRPLGDAWAWSRKGSAVDISPLVAVTLAFWGNATIQSTPWVGVW